MSNKMSKYVLFFYGSIKRRELEADKTISSLITGFQSVSILMWL